MHRIWIENDALSEMLDESRAQYPSETGGLLAGYFSTDNEDIVVTNVTRPGPHALHLPMTYRPDYAHDEDAIGAIYDSSDGVITYLGDWHSHPLGSGVLSWRDKRALRNIVRNGGNDLENPVMLIAADAPEWVSHAWRLTACKRGMFGPPCTCKRLELLRFTA